MSHVVSAALFSRAVISKRKRIVVLMVTSRGVIRDTRKLQIAKHLWFGTELG